ncbi:hypothetical protein LS66_004310 [Helicobacter sp. MIT 03-1614]|uniref:hypothetical protein n=1 Tax=Helicobacter TaxID=209 RepID=UPI0005131C40|nr:MULTISPECIES: hypothetical protein [Helicobacter]TLD89538.1 hypothetical protein LS66_004310 [Helicobacter sp. MIT 03-1614]
MIEKKLKRKKTLIKIKKILKVFKALFILWIIYLIGIPLYYTPYELQPSYWKIKEICELDIMPHSKKRTEKLLKVFRVNPNNLQNNLKLENNNYIVRIRYDTKRIKAQLNVEMDSKKNITKINESGSVWYNLRPTMLGNEGNMDFRLIWDNYLTCGDILIKNMPECFKDNKFICNQL